MLVGVQLDGGWRVLSRAQRPSASTGGNFSVGYLVESSTGERGFLKALDFADALQSPDPAAALQLLTEAFNFERLVLDRCDDADRVVTAKTSGTARVNVAGRLEPVQYLIFELASGDVRSQVVPAKQHSAAWGLRVMHQVATGLRQLHDRGIVHQDLKPSNVLTFPNIGSKVADLGRAAYKGHSPPHDSLAFAGDPGYAPPELLYGYVDPDWNRRRVGGDLYLLGSLVAFFFSGGGAVTPMLLLALPQSLHPGHWAGDYTSVLPYVRNAFNQAMSTIEPVLPQRLRPELLRIIRELCDPDPTRRGHHRNRGNPATQYFLERYIAEFDLLARRANIVARAP